jgi:hypothetical protein
MFWSGSFIQISAMSKYSAVQKLLKFNVYNVLVKMLELNSINKTIAFVYVCHHKPKLAVDVRYSSVHRLNVSQSYRGCNWGCNH